MWFLILNILITVGATKFDIQTERLKSLDDVSFSQMIALCHRQLDMVKRQVVLPESKEGINISLESVCDYYSIICNYQTDPNCCPIDRHTIEDSFCAIGHVCLTKLWNYLSNGLYNCSKSDKQCNRRKDAFSKRYPTDCRATSINISYTNREYFALPENDGYEWLLWPSPVVLKGQTISRYAQVSLAKENSAEYSSDVTYRWAVLRGDELVNPSPRTNITMSSNGKISLQIRNASVADNGTYDFYVDKCDDSEQPKNSLPADKKKNLTKVNPRIKAMAVKRSDVVVIDPEDNFARNSIKNFTIQVSRNEDGDYPRVKCSANFDVSQWARLHRFIYFAIFDFPNLHVDLNDDTNKHDDWATSEVKASELYKLAGTTQRVFNLSLEYNINNTRELSGSLICVLHTAVGLFAIQHIHNVSAPNVLEWSRPVLFYGVPACAGIFILAAAILLVRRHKRLVIVTVHRNENYACQVASESLLQDDNSVFLSDNNYVPMRTFPTANIRREDVPEYLAPTLPSTRNSSSVGSDAYPSSSTALTRLSSDTSSGSHLPVISAEPDEDSYGFINVEFKRLNGNADAVVLKSKRFKVKPCVELMPYVVPYNQVKLLDVVGSGNFGLVRKGVITFNGRETAVAIKALHEGATFASLKDLVVEATSMAVVGQHVNLVSIIGVCLERKPCLAMEYCELGDLENLLKDAVASHANDEDIETMKPLFYQWALDIASGVAFLHTKKFVHRDLATRNVLVTDSFTCKVSDFGLARDMGSHDYYRIQNRKPLPCRWLAPEIFRDYIFSPASDMWAFAVTMWELFNFGAKPYPELYTNDAVQHFVLQGKRLKFGELDDSLLSLLERCWQHPEERPTAGEIKTCLLSMDKGEVDPAKLKLVLFMIWRKK